METNTLYPIFLDLRGKPCLVIGAGEVALRKILSLIEALASTTVVAPHAAPEVLELAANDRIVFHERPFAPSDLDGCALAVAATGDPTVNRLAKREAELRRVPCNVVDVPELCDFHVPAVATSGSLKIAVSTNGRAPALAARVRRDLETRFGPRWAEAVRIMGELRDSLRNDPSLGEEDRRAVLSRAAVSAELDRFLDGSSPDIDPEKLR